MLASAVPDPRRPLPAADDEEPSELPLIDGAFRYVAERALHRTAQRRVGLELEFHVIDRSSPAVPVSWARLSRLLTAGPMLPAASVLSAEPGGQLELSTRPLADVVSAVSALRADASALARRLHAENLALVSVGADPVRRPARVNPAARYAAMEQHFAAVSSASAASTMMCATAALQVNVDAGPAISWAERVAHLHRLGPVLVAAGACSPLAGGHASGWRSMRRQVWHRLDPARCSPLQLTRAAGERAAGARQPAEDWARYALAAPVMLVRDERTGAYAPVRKRVPFAAWVQGADIGHHRRPTTADLDYHLTTLFPPVRLRGFLELRYLDAVPARWWPGLAALVVTLADDPVAADRAADVCAPVADCWTAAARRGLSDPRLARAATACAEIAVDRAPAALRQAVREYADLIVRGADPASRLIAMAAESGPLRMFSDQAAQDMEAYLGA